MSKVTTRPLRNAGFQASKDCSCKECRMKVATFALTLLCLFPSLSLAAQVYGTLRESNRPVGPNVKVEIVCGSNKYSAVTDNYGSYKLFPEETGKCTLPA